MNDTIVIVIAVGAAILFAALSTLNGWRRRRVRGRPVTVGIPVSASGTLRRGVARGYLRFLAIINVYGIASSLWLLSSPAWATSWWAMFAVVGETLALAMLLWACLPREYNTDRYPKGIGAWFEKPLATMAGLCLIGWLVAHVVVLYAIGEPLVA